MCQHCMGANQVSRRATKSMPEIREMPYPQRLRKLKLVDSPQCMALKLEEGRYTFEVEETILSHSVMTTCI